MAKSSKTSAKDGSRRGGARPNSGPKPRVVKAAIADANAASLARLTAWLPSLLDNMRTLANGVKLRDEDDDGTFDYYISPPDRQANEYLINRVLGKPTERKEVSGPEGGSIPHSVELAIGKFYGGGE